PIDHVVEPGFQRDEQIGALYALLRAGPLERRAELTFGEAVDPLHLLLFSQLARVLRHLAPAAAAVGLAMLARRVPAALHRALLGETAGALEEQLHAFATAETAAGSGVTCHGSDPALLRRPAPVVRNRGDVLDGNDPQAHRGERLN